MKEVRRSYSGVDILDIGALQDDFEHLYYECASSSLSGDALSSSGALSASFGELRSEHGRSSSGSSPLVGTWPAMVVDKGPLTSRFSSLSSKQVLAPTAWDDKKQNELSEISLMKEKFSKLLLGEDMSGSGKGVCSALAISNAITNLSASIFGELWKLEPLSDARKAMWKREMDWLLSLADHIVELVPSMQSFPDGSKFEIMITRARSDIHINLPALRKLDAMLLDALDNFSKTEFWYASKGDQGDDHNEHAYAHQDKWWLPTPKVPADGLSDEGRRRLQHQRESLNQILKAAVAINSQVLSEMEIPVSYWEALPKNGKASLGERLYRHFTLEFFSSEALLDSIDVSSEHKVLGVANQIEAAMHIWSRRQSPRNLQMLSKECKQNKRNSSGGVSDANRREMLASRAENTLICLKQRFPELRQSFLEMSKIQHNKDVGQSILESYSRVLESLASNIIARIDDVLHVDDEAKHSLAAPTRESKACTAESQRHMYSLSLPVNTPPATPLCSPCASPIPSPSRRQAPNSPLHDELDTQDLPGYMVSCGYEVEYESLRPKEAISRGH